MLDNISEEGESTPRRRGKKKKKGKSKKGKGRNFLKKYKKLKKKCFVFSRDAARRRTSGNDSAGNGGGNDDGRIWRRRTAGLFDQTVQKKSVIGMKYCLIL